MPPWCRGLYAGRLRVDGWSQSSKPRSCCSLPSGGSWFPPLRVGCLAALLLAVDAAAADVIAPARPWAVWPAWPAAIGSASAISWPDPWRCASRLPRRDQLTPAAWAGLYAALAVYFQRRVPFPAELRETLSDEHYLRNVVAVLFEPGTKRP